MKRKTASDTKKHQPPDTEDDMRAPDHTDDPVIQRLIKEREARDALFRSKDDFRKLLDDNPGNGPSGVEKSNTWSDALENVADAVLTCVPGGEMALAIKKAIKDPTYLSKMSNAELVGLLASTALDFTPTGKVLKAAKNSKFLVKFGDRLRRNLSRRLKAATHACSTQVSSMGTAGLGAFLFPEMVEQVGKQGARGTAKATGSNLANTWNEFQKLTKGQFASRAEAGAAWYNYKQAHQIAIEVVRNQVQKGSFLKTAATSGKYPKWMNQWLQKGKVPPGYHVDHIVPLSIGGKDIPTNMRLLDIKTHIEIHYKPWLKK